MLPVGRLLPVVLTTSSKSWQPPGIRQILSSPDATKARSRITSTTAARRPVALATASAASSFSSRTNPRPPAPVLPSPPGRAFAADEPFVVAFGDSIVRTHSGRPLLQRMIDSHLRHGTACTIGAYEVPEDQMHHYGILIPEEATAADSKLTAILEKPTPAQTSSRLPLARATCSLQPFSPTSTPPRPRRAARCISPTQLPP